MATLLFLASLIVFSYASFVKGKFNVKSISESYYWLSHISPNLGLLFTAWCVAPAFILFPMWVEIMPENWQFLSFLSVVFLGAVGCAPRYLKEQRIAHFAFTALALILSITACAVLGLWYIPAILIVGTTAVMIVKKRADYLYWIEMAAFVAIFLTVSINY